MIVTVGEKAALARKKARASRVKGRTFVGERPCLSSLQRAGKTFAAAAVIILSVRCEPIFYASG
jgi:hypothetical protein